MSEQPEEQTQDKWWWRGPQRPRIAMLLGAAALVLGGVRWAVLLTDGGDTGALVLAVLWTALGVYYLAWAFDRAKQVGWGGPPPREPGA